MKCPKCWNTFIRLKKKLFSPVKMSMARWEFCLVSVAYESLHVSKNWLWIIIYDLYEYASATIFVDMYPWFYMPASVHQILIRRAGTLPKGMFSKEPLEARNKNLRKFRFHNCRNMLAKIPRKAWHIPFTFFFIPSLPCYPKVQRRLQKDQLWRKWNGSVIL